MIDAIFVKISNVRVQSNISPFLLTSKIGVKEFHSGGEVKGRGLFLG